MNVTTRPMPTAICLACGSPSPDDISPDCSHAEVARFAELPNEVRDLVVRLRRAKSYLSGALVTLREAAVMEERSGRAIVDRQNAVAPPPQNVRFLRSRPELVRLEPEPVNAQFPEPLSEPAPTTQELVMLTARVVTGPKPPPLKLTAPKPSRKRPKNAPSPPPRRRSEPPVGDLFEPAKPDT